MKLNDPADNYINAVCKKVRPRSAREELRRELTDHLEEKTEALIAQGLTAQAAEMQAVAQMGNADIIAKKMNRVYHPLVYTIIKYAFLAATVFIGFAALYPYFMVFSQIPNAALTDAAAIGVIGGADGPTAVFISTPTAVFPIFIACACITAILFLFPYIKRKL
ncbi:MAG: permease prefix domain 1-containing protein, partial [Christensenella sp.]